MLSWDCPFNDMTIVVPQKKTRVCFQPETTATTRNFYKCPTPPQRICLYNRNLFGTSVQHTPSELFTMLLRHTTRTCFFHRFWGVSHSNTLFHGKSISEYKVIYIENSIKIVFFQKWAIPTTCNWSIMVANFSKSLWTYSFISSGHPQNSSSLAKGCYEKVTSEAEGRASSSSTSGNFSLRANFSLRPGPTRPDRLDRLCSNLVCGLGVTKYVLSTSHGWGGASLHVRTSALTPPPRPSHLRISGSD